MAAGVTGSSYLSLQSDVAESSSSASTPELWSFGDSRSVVPGGGTRKKSRKITKADSITFETNILPRMISGEIRSFYAAALALKMRKDFFTSCSKFCRPLISLNERTFKKTHPLFAGMTSEGRAKLQELLDKSHKAESKENGRKRVQTTTNADSQKFENEILPAMIEGKIESFAEASRALGKGRNYLTDARAGSTSISIKNRSFNDAHPLFAGMTDNGRVKLKEFINNIAEQVRNSEHNDFHQWSRARGRGRLRKRTEPRPTVPRTLADHKPEGSPNNFGGPHVIETPGISFNDVYSARIESEAGASYTVALQHSRGAQTRAPSPGFFDDVSSTGPAGTNSEASVCTRAGDFLAGGVPRRSPPGFEQAQHSDLVDAGPSMGGMSRTPTQHSESPALERLDDREFGILLEAVNLPQGIIRSVEDAAMWLDDRGQGESLLARVRQYVSVVGDGDGAHIQLTEFGRKAAEERAQREGSAQGGAIKRQRISSHQPPNDSAWTKA
ncbi:MAG TPA: hypothetical protein VFP68_22170 [Burkholderiaceae bacterium]|nr:hypothetical protein [Burkholderiaceae bacterium]